MLIATWHHFALAAILVRHRGIGLPKSLSFRDVWRADRQVSDRPESGKWSRFAGRFFPSSQPPLTPRLPPLFHAAPLCSLVLRPAPLRRGVEWGAIVLAKGASMEGKNLYCRAIPPSPLCAAPAKRAASSPPNDAEGCEARPSKGPQSPPSRSVRSEYQDRCGEEQKCLRPPALAATRRAAAAIYMERAHSPPAGGDRMGGSLAALLWPAPVKPQWLRETTGRRHTTPVSRCCSCCARVVAIHWGCEPLRMASQGGWGFGGRARLAPMVALGFDHHGAAPEIDKWSGCFGKWSGRLSCPERRPSTMSRQIRLSEAAA